MAEKLGKSEKIEKKKNPYKTVGLFECKPVEEQEN